MRIKRITIEIEVPLYTVTSHELIKLVSDFLEVSRLPHQAQVSNLEMSPNIRIGNITDFDGKAWRKICR